MTSSPDIITTMICGPTSHDGTKGEIYPVLAYQIGNKVIRRIISALVLTTTAGSFTQVEVGVLHNGVPNAAYDQGAGEVNLDSAVQNLLCFGTALDDTMLVWIKVEVIAPMVPAVTYILQ